MNKKRILYILSTLRSCGPVNQLFSIISNLDAEKYEPIVITLSSEPARSQMSRYKDAGIKIIQMNLSRFQGMIFGKVRLKVKLKELKPEIVHTQGVRADIIVSKLSGDFCHITTIRNYAYEDYTAKFGAFMGRVLAYRHISAIKTIKDPVACSKSLAQILQKKENIELDYIQNGVDERKYFKSTSEQKLKLREKLKLSKDARIFVMSGALIERKNPLFAIQAFNEANLQNAQLVLIGDGVLMQECKKYESKNILVLGYVNSVIEYLQASDVLISSSKSEGLPNSILEAIAVGLPVILSDIPQHMEILNTDSNMGDSFSLSHTKYLTELIKKYAEVNLKSKSKSACEALKNNFTAKIMSKKYQDKYDCLLNGKK